MSPTVRPLVEAVSAETVIGCSELGPTLGFFTDQLGFRLALISPADAPTTAVVEGFGLRVRLMAGGAADGAGAAPPPPGRLRLVCRGLAPIGVQILVAPNGTLVELVAAEPAFTLPPVASDFELSRFDPDVFGTGRAGMQYRDLLPGRQGGRFIASHIRIPDGGPVPDYVHYHLIRFQIIYCYRGWVRLVYEDQGPPFVMEAGDCVLQPPGIRHRVLESSPGLEVVEVGCPAVHDTLTDPDLELPTPVIDPDRVFDGGAPTVPQRFAWHRAGRARWETDAAHGTEVRDTGVGAATGGLADVRVLRPIPAAATGPYLAPSPEAELTFVFVLSGRARLARPGQTEVALQPADAVALPPDAAHRIDDWSADCQLLEVRLPAGG